MSADPQAGRLGRRQTYIQLRMDSMIEQYRQQRQRRWWLSCAECKPSSGNVGESVTRCINFLRFSVTCCAGAVNAMAPWALATAEATTVLLVYFLAAPDALFVRVPLTHYRYRFDISCEDVVVLSLLRFAMVVTAYLLGAGPQYQRPYLYAAFASGALSLPLVLLKTALLQHSSVHRAQWSSHFAIYTAHAGFSIAHMVAAQRVVTWARRRYEMGLLGFGYPWEEGEQTWLLAGRLRSGQLMRGPPRHEGGSPAAAAAAGLAAAEDGDAGPGVPEMHDVPAEQLADTDSQFLEDCLGLQVHYKMALPPGTVEPGESAILLIHSFGGGTFSWRHLLQPLADATGLAVVAFDRPGFGLTSRPEVTPRTPLEENPYSLRFQSVLTLKLAWQLGLQKVLFIGHEDGALLALMATAQACRQQRFTFSPIRTMPPPLPAEPSPVPFPRRVAPPAAPLPIPQSMDAAWEGWLLREGGQNNNHHHHHLGFLQRLLKGDFSPSPSSSLLEGFGGRDPLHQQQQQQVRRPLARLHSQQQQLGMSWLSQYSLDRLSLPGWTPQEAQPGLVSSLWLQQQLASQGPPLGYAVLPEEGEDECPLLPRSTDTSPPHTVGQPRQEPAPWLPRGQQQQQQQQPQQQPQHGQLGLPPGWPEGPAEQLPLQPAVLQPARQQPLGPQKAVSGSSGACSLPRLNGSAGGSRAAGRALHKLLRASNGESGDQRSSHAAAVLAAPVQQQMESAPGTADDTYHCAVLDRATGGPANAAASSADMEQQPQPTTFSETEGHAVAAAAAARDRDTGHEGSQGLLLGETPISAVVAQHSHWLHPPDASQQQQQQQHAVPTPALQRQSQQQQQGQLQGVGGSESEEVETPSWHVARGWQLPRAVGLVLLHPDLSGQVAPRYTRVLANSRLGRRMLRPLLRTEVGEVSNRRAWCDDSLLTPDLLELYKRPLQIENWDAALVEVCRVKNELHWIERAHLLGEVASSGIPVMVMTGERDHMSTPTAAAVLSERLPGSRLAVLPGCGHLAHEERPETLLDFLAAFVRDVAGDGEGGFVPTAGVGGGHTTFTATAAGGPASSREAWDP